MEREAIQRVETWMSRYRSNGHVGSPAERAELLLAILNDHHGSNRLRLTYVCAGLGCTLRSVERVFKAKYGESMHEVQKRLRMERINWCMRADPEMKLSALAFEMGYDRLSEFSRYFRNREGMTPREYIENVILPELAKEAARERKSFDA